MRIWDLEPERLCRQHLLGEHRELHALWVILTQDKQGFSRHPETLRWRGKLQALYFGMKAWSPKWAAGVIGITRRCPRRRPPGWRSRTNTRIRRRSRWKY